MNIRNFSSLVLMATFLGAALPSDSTAQTLVYSQTFTRTSTNSTDPIHSTGWMSNRGTSGTLDDDTTTSSSEGIVIGSANPNQGGYLFAASGLGESRHIYWTEATGLTVDIADIDRFEVDLRNDNSGENIRLALQIGDGIGTDDWYVSNTTFNSTSGTTWTNDIVIDPDTLVWQVLSFVPGNGPTGLGDGLQPLATTSLPTSGTIQAFGLYNNGTAANTRIDNFEIYTAGADIAPPGIDSLSPVNGASEVAASVDLVITFTETVVAVPGHNIRIFDSADPVTPVETIAADASNVTVAGEVVTIDPSGDLSLGVSYFVEIDSGAFDDLSGNPFPGISGSGTWGFTIQASPPSSALIGFQAEGGDSSTTGVVAAIGSEYNLGNDASALDGAYLVTTTGVSNVNYPNSDARTVSYEITLPEAGTYDVYARVYVDGDGSNDSFFYATDFGDADPTADGDWYTVNGLADSNQTGSIGAGEYEWINLTEFGWTETASPLIVTSAGTVTWEVGVREPGLRIDAFAFGTTGETYTDFELSVASLGADETDPQVDSLSPASSETDVLPWSNLTVTFDELVFAVPGGKIRIYDSTDLINPVEVIAVDGPAVNVQGAVVTINPANGNLSPGASYVVEIDDGAFEDIFGNPFAGIAQGDWGFTIRPVPPTLAQRFADMILEVYPTINVDNKGWEYTNGIILHGISEVYAMTGDTRYLEYVQAFADRFLESDGGLPGNVYSNYNIDTLQPGGLLFKLHAATGDNRYKVAADETRARFNSYPRTLGDPDGGFWHKSNYPNQMWVDGIYMGQPFLAGYARYFGDADWCFDTAAAQAIMLADIAQDPATGLLKHAWDASGNAAWADPVTGLSPEVWSRGTGWYIMALVDILRYLPVDHAERPRLIEILQDLADGIATYQDPASGLWYQVVDKGHLPDNWLETSGSAMIVYSLKVAVDAGYIDPGFQAVAEDGWAGLMTMITVDSEGRPQITNACQGMSVQTSYANYINKARWTNSPHGLLGILLAASRMESFPTRQILSIERNGASGMTLAWPAEYGWWRLRGSSELETWMPRVPEPAIDNGVFRVTLPIDRQREFFTLGE